MYLLLLYIPESAESSSVLSTSWQPFAWRLNRKRFFSMFEIIVWNRIMLATGTWPKLFGSISDPDQDHRIQNPEPPSESSFYRDCILITKIMAVSRMKLNYTVHLVVTNLTNLAIFHKENDVTLYRNYFRIKKGNIRIRNSANPSLKVF